MFDGVVRARAVLPSGETPEPIEIRVEHGRIAGITRTGSAANSQHSGYLDHPDLLVAPGLIDVHTHGGWGVQVIDGRGDAIGELAQFYIRSGVTGFLATVGGSRDHIEAGIAAVVAYQRAPDPGGARCLGLHLEGPFISEHRLGAFRRDSVAPPDIELFEHYADLAEGHLKLITIAPEVPGAEAVVKAALQRGIRCSAGHSEASAEQMTAAVDAGITSVTHMFNAMPSLHHRTPGLAAVAMTDRRLIVEAIADGVHLDPLALRLLLLAKGIERIALITDSIAATGLPDGDYLFEEQKVLVRGGEARLADGTLAGSTLTMDRAVRHFARYAAIPWARAVFAATAVPARLLGLDHRVGHIAVGMGADLVAVDDRHEVVWTMVNGEIGYRRQGGPDRSD